MFRLFAFLIGYAIGTLQTSYFVGKFYGIDIRDHGSKNAGMTNVTRTLGKKAGIFVFFVDVLKTMLAFYIAASVFYDGGVSFSSWSFARWGGVGFNLILPGVYAGVGTIIGHCFPIFLKFRGGKGIACTLGLIIMLDIRVMAITFAVGFIVAHFSRYISLASMTITLLVPILLLIFGYDIEIVGITAFITALTWFLHRSNIKRLTDGTENKI